MKGRISPLREILDNSPDPTAEIKQRRVPTSQAVTPTDERVKRLLSGDWTPYLKATTEVTPYANTTSGLGTPIASIDEWDWGLLRHDVHVLYSRGRQ